MPGRKNSSPLIWDCHFFMMMENRGLYCLYDVSIVFVQILHQIGDAVVVLEFFRMIL